MSEPSVGELERRLISLEQDLKEDIRSLVISQNNFINQISDVSRSMGIAANTLSGVENRIRTLESAEIGRMAERVDSNVSRLNALESFNTWLVRTVFGAIIVGALGLLFVLQGGPS